EHVHGRLTMDEAPAIAARIYALPRDAWGPTIPQALTDENGFFDLDLPPGTTVFDGLAVHPAFDIVIGRSTIRKGKELHVRTQQIGGTITVESTSNDILLLVHNGGEMRADWIADLAGGASAPGRLTVPRLEPGQYSVCTLKRSSCA